jgi:hypothetical protein
MASKSGWRAFSQPTRAIIVEAGLPPAAVVAKDSDIVFEPRRTSVRCQLRKIATRHAMVIDLVSRQCRRF